MNLYFTSEIRECLDLFNTPMALKTCSGKIVCNDSLQFQREMRKISRRRLRSVDDTELGHFTELFCRGQERNVQRVLLYLPTQIRFLIGGERVTGHWSKLSNALGRTTTL